MLGCRRQCSTQPCIAEDTQVPPQPSCNQHGASAQQALSMLHSFISLNLLSWTRTEPQQVSHVFSSLTALLQAVVNVQLQPPGRFRSGPGGVYGQQRRA